MKLSATIIGVACLACTFALGCGGAPQQPEAETGPGATAIGTPAVGEQPQVAHHDGPAQLNDNTDSFEVAGIRVIHKHTPGNPIVDLRVFFDGGAAMWDPERAGAERLALTVASSGGPTSMSRHDYTAALEAMGSSVSGTSGLDYATLAMSSVEAYAEDTFELFVAMARDPAFREADVELRREQFTSAVRAELDEPDSALVILARDYAFAGHPYAIRAQGTVETLAALTIDDLREAYGRLFVKSRMLVVVVGNLERARVEAMVSEAFGDLDDDLSPPFHPPVPHLFSYGESSVMVERRADLPTNYILGYFGAPEQSDDDFPALQAAMEILSDRLFEEVRTRRNLTYAVSSGLSTRRSPTGYLYVTATDPRTTVEVMLDTLDDIVESGVPESELRAQIEGYLTRYYRGLQTSSAQAGLLGDWELVGGGRANADVHVRRLEQVTSADIERVADRYARGIRFVVIGDPDEVDTTVFTRR